MSKIVTLRGQPWLVRIDSCRFYVRPGEGNPLIDRNEQWCLEYKYNDGPASELADLMFASLPGRVVPDPLHVFGAVDCPVHGIRRASSTVDDFGKAKCDVCLAAANQ